MMSSRLLAFQLSGGPPYGLRLQGGDGTLFVISKIRPASKAEAVGLLEGDVLVAVNGIRCRGLSHATTTALMDLNDHLLTVHILRGNSAMMDLTAAERSMGSQLTVLSESEAAALTGGPQYASSVVQGAVADKTFGNTADNFDRQVVASVGGGHQERNLVSQPEAMYSRSEQSFNDGGTERRTVEEKETKKYGGTTMTTVTRKEYSTYSSGGSGAYQPRQDPFVMSLQDEVLQPDWYGERREDRTKYSVSQSQPAQGSTGPPSKLEYVGSYVVGGAKPYGDDEMTRPVIWTEPTRSAGMNNQVQPGPERQPPQSQPVVVESWQQTQVNPSAVRTYYEGDIKPGQNVVMPGFTISIEAPRHSGGQIAGPKPIVTITPADSDTHVMTVTQPGEWQVPSITTIRTPGSSQQHHDAQIVPQSDWYAQRQQQYNQKTAEFQHQPVTEFRQVTNATQQEMATDRQWQYKPTPLMTTDDDGAWYKPADVRVETQRSRLENVGSDWNEAVMQKPSYGSSEPVGNITVTVGDRPHFIYKPELPQVISLPKVTQHDPKFVEEQYGFSQQTLPIQHQNNTLPSQSLQNHGLDQEHTVSKIQQPVFGEDVVYPYSPPARMEKSHSWSGQQIPSFAQPLPSQPMTSQYPGQGTLQHSQPTDQGSYACPPSAYPASSLQSPTNSSDYYLSNSSHPDLKRSSSYTAGFPPPHQGQSYPPVTPYSTVSKDPYSPQYRPPSQTDSYQNEPQTAPVKSTFKLPLNPNFNKALFGGEVTNEQTAPSNQTYFGQDNKFSAQQQQQQQQDGGYNSQASSIQPPYDSAYGGPKVWSPPPVQGQNPQMNPWQAGGQTAWGYGDQMMNAAAADVGGYYNAVPTAVNQMPPNMMPPPPPLAPAPPPPPLPPPPPENPLKVYGITTSSSDPERKNLESKVKLANSVAHAVLSPENVNSRGQKMFLRRRQNSHKWTTSGPDPTSTNDDTRQQPMSPPSWSGQRPQPSFASQSQPQSTMMPRHPPPGQGLSRSPQPERRNPIQEYGVDRGGKGGAMFAKLQQRSESAGSLQSAGITDRSALPLQSYPTQFQGKNLGGSGAAVQQMRSWAGQQSPHGMNQYRPPPPTVMVTNHQFGISDL